MASDDPLRSIKLKADQVLESLSPAFDEVYASIGRPSIPPEQLIRSLLWMALFSIRSETLLLDMLKYDMRARWFVGLGIEDSPWDQSAFSKNREVERLQVLSRLFFEQHLAFLRAEGLLSHEHLSVDGTLLAAWASHKSLVLKAELDKDGKPPPPPDGGRNAWTDFKGQQRSNKTHQSATDPEAKLASKGVGAKLSFELNILTENRNNFAIAAEVTSPSGTSEREAAARMVKAEHEAGRTPETLGGDRNYANGDELIIELLTVFGVVPHFAPRDDRPNSLASLLLQHLDGYKTSIKKRMRIEEVFAFLKTVGGLARVKLRGTDRVEAASLIALAAYNLTHEVSLAG